MRSPEVNAEAGQPAQRRRETGGVLAAIRREYLFFTRMMRAAKALADLSPTSTVTVADDFEAAADLHAKGTAIIFEGRTWSFADLEARANRYARWARAQGFVKGDVVALFMQNRPDYIAAWLGFSKVGVATALVNSNLSGAAIAHSVDIARARAVVVGAELASEWFSASSDLKTPVDFWFVRDPGVAEDLPAGVRDLDAALAEQAPSRLAKSEARPDLCGADLLFYIYTSGTTGAPKAAHIDSARGQGLLRTFHRILKLGPADKVYVTLPLYHGAGGFCGVGAALMSGAGMVLRRKFSASNFWSDVAAHKVTAFVYIGELCRYLVNAPPSPQEQGHSVRAAFGSGMRVDVWERFEARFRIPTVIEFYGSTEGNVSFMNFDGKRGAVGRVPAYLRKSITMKLVRFDVEREQPVRDAAGRCIEVAPGEAGEALGRVGSTLREAFKGYAGDPSHTEKKILRDVFEPGDMWFRTGDLLRQDADGYVYFVDRVGDTFRWKGENVATGEVAEVVASAPGVEEVNVYGVRVGDADGRAGMAAIVPGESFSLEALARVVCARLPSYARPFFIRLTAEADTTGTMKYKKTTLVDEGFDPARIVDPLYLLDAEAGRYVPLTPALYADVLAGRVRL